MNHLRIFLSMLLFVSTGAFAECGGVDEKITALLKEKKYAEAEQLALESKKKSPDDIEAHLRLAYVYVTQALPEEIFVDTRAMGLGDNETGTVQLKGKEDVEKYIKPRVGHKPEFGVKAEQAFREIIAQWEKDKRAYWCLMNYYQQAQRHADLVAFIPEVVTAFKDEGYALVDQLLPYPARYGDCSKFCVRLNSNFQMRV